MAKRQSTTISRSGEVSEAAKEARAAKWCKLCLEDLGEQRLAHRILPKDGGRCEEHFRHGMNMPQLSPKAEIFISRWRHAMELQAAARTAQPEPQSAPPEQASVSIKRPSVQSNGVFVSRSSPKERPMGRLGRRIDEATAAEIRKDFAAGMNINAISEKRKVSWPAVKSIVKSGGAKASRANGHAKPANGYAPTNGVFFTVGVELLDRCWLALPPEKKAALLGML